MYPNKLLPTELGVCGSFVVALLLALATANPAESRETRGYVIARIHLATWAHSENCPQGGNGDLVEIQKRILMTDFGYSETDAVKILAEGSDGNGQQIDISKRGRLDGQPVDVHTIPSSVPDPKMETVQGRYSYGFNLNGRADKNTFEHPETGERGIDNQMWRALGCFDVYAVRRPVEPYSEGIAWDTAMDAMPAWLMSISGEDLDQDGEVTVRFDRALSVTMRDATGRAMRAASYIADSDPRSSNSFRGRIRNGVVTIDPGDFSLQGESQFYAILRFTNAQVRLKLHPDGSLEGELGGYQPWLDYIHYLSIRGEGTGQVHIPGAYYAMQRLADADPDPVTGQNRAISAAYYTEAEPVFITDRDGNVLAWAHEPRNAEAERFAADRGIATAPAEASAN